MAMSATGIIDGTRRALGTVARLGLGLSILLLFGITVLVSGQVLMRNVFSVGLPWADELARYFGIAMVYLTVPHLLDRGQHIAVELLPNALTGRARAVVLLVAELSVIAFAALSVWGFARFLERAARFSTPALGMPNLVFYMPALLGIVLLALVAVLRAITTLRDGEPG